MILARDFNRAESISSGIKIASDVPPIQLPVNDLMAIASSLGTDTLTVGVRIRTESGHKSKIQQIKRISINPIPARLSSGRNFGALILIATAMVLIACAMKGCYRIYHRSGGGTALTARYTRHIENSQQTPATINTNNNHNVNHLDDQYSLLESETHPEIE